MREEPRRAGLFDRFMPNRRPGGREETVSASTPAPAPQPRMAPQNQPQSSRAGEDFDIPAFLRRQAN
jgi:cell division protein FtsZ